MFLLQLTNKSTNTSVYQRLIINRCMQLNCEYKSKSSTDEEWLILTNFVTSPAIKTLKRPEEYLDWQELKRKIVITKVDQTDGAVTEVIIECIKVA